MRAIVLALGLVSAPAMAADQFDLVCKGKSGSTTRYRVDLTRGEACAGICDRVWKMGATTTSEYRLIDQSPVRGYDLEQLATVNRQTGAYSHYSKIRGLGANRTEGTCEVAQFSGFPAAKF